MTFRDKLNYTYFVIRQKPEIKIRQSRKNGGITYEETSTISSFRIGSDSRSGIGQIVQDRVLSISEGKDNVLNGEKADIYAILGENDKLTGSVAEDKVLYEGEGTQTENESQSDSYAVLEENDKLTGSIVEDKVKK